MALTGSTEEEVVEVGGGPKKASIGFKVMFSFYFCALGRWRVRGGGSVCFETINTRLDLLQYVFDYIIILNY